MRIVEQYLAQLNIEKRRWRRATAILTVLSIFVAAGIAWNLRMTGITLVNDACCGYEEHRHTEECMGRHPPQADFYIARMRRGNRCIRIR